MAYFSENRDSSSAGPKKWNDDALGVMRGEMSSLAKDDKFHDYLKIPVVSRALKYDKNRSFSLRLGTFSLQTHIFPTQTLDWNS